jgi:phosphoenolpyruvate synthase/pyruvate phosphate dikinase
MRKRGEDIYKYGENVFVPRYTEWLADNIDGNYSASDLRYVTHREFLDFIEKSKVLPKKSELIDRAKYFLGFYCPIGKEKYLSGDNALREVARLELFKEIDSSVGAVDEFSGQVAFKGKVTGKVVLVSKREDMAKFKDGEIIVSPMTEPGYIPIMKKASAFITNEGGLLCHAAIVAREMKKPCIIGTKIATKVLKDGMTVEVDANTGLVKIIKN